MHGHLNEKINLHCGHLSDKISIDPQNYADNSGFFSKMESATYNADIWAYFLQYIHDCQFKIPMDNKHFQIFQTRQIITE
jgi:hypothetical protein